MSQPWANIHHFDGTLQDLVDDDGDVLQGWYFQHMDGDKPTGSLTGPYGSSKECESAAIKEYMLA